jgi:hypothetical protein
LTCPGAVRLCLGVLDNDGAALNTYVGATAKLQLQFGFLLAVVTAVDWERGKFI